MEMKVNQIQEITETEFDARVLQATQPAVVGFVSDWSQACGRFGPMLAELAGTCNGTAKVFKVDVDDNPDLGTVYAIQSVPTLMIFLDGAVRVKIVGTVSAKAILAKLQSLSDEKSSTAGFESNQAKMNPEI